MERKSFFHRSDQHSGYRPSLSPSRQQALLPQPLKYASQASLSLSACASTVAESVDSRFVKTRRWYASVSAPTKTSQPSHRAQHGHGSVLLDRLRKRKNDTGLSSVWSAFRISGGLSRTSLEIGASIGYVSHLNGSSLITSPRSVNARSLSETRSF